MRSWYWHILILPSNMVSMFMCFIGKMVSVSSSGILSPLISRWQYRRINTRSCDKMYGYSVHTVYVHKVNYIYFLISTYQIHFAESTLWINYTAKLTFGQQELSECFFFLQVFLWVCVCTTQWTGDNWTVKYFLFVSLCWICLKKTVIPSLHTQYICKYR